MHPALPRCQLGCKDCVFRPGMCLSLSETRSATSSIYAELSGTLEGEFAPILVILRSDDELDLCYITSHLPEYSNHIITELESVISVQESSAGDFRGLLG